MKLKGIDPYLGYWYFVIIKLVGIQTELFVVDYDTDLKTYFISVLNNYVCGNNSLCTKLYKSSSNKYLNQW